MNKQLIRQKTMNYWISDNSVTILLLTISNNNILTFHGWSNWHNSSVLTSELIILILHGYTHHQPVCLSDSWVIKRNVKHILTPFATLRAVMELHWQTELLYLLQVMKKGDQYLPLGLSSSMATMVAGGPVLESLHSEMEGEKVYTFQKC